MSFECEQSVNVATERDVVWRLLIDASTWKTWWSDCVDATAADRRTLHEGSKLELALQPKQLKYTFYPEVDLTSEGKSLSLTHRSLFVQWTVSWFLQDLETGTRVTARGSFAGLGTLLPRIFHQDDTARFSLNSNLRGLKRLAERMV
ncbi:MAG: hypothetical protein HC897_15480 [Thermoanaerobaculia bacterium]|nr:hypothetical protein [Thermoanaerobaculia bacterium]